jgi:hypothetical protein
MRQYYMEDAYANRYGMESASLRPHPVSMAVAASAAFIPVPVVSSGKAEKNKYTDSGRGAVCVGRP